MASKTQADQVFEELRADILACRLPPGVKVRINELSGRFDVSLGAVREALSRLTADGLVLSEAQKGCTVAPVSRADLVDLTATRIEIEALCMADALAHGNLDWESRIVAAFHKLGRIPERDPDDRQRLNQSWSVAHAEFHEALVSGCESAWLLRIRATLYARSERYRHLSVPLGRGDRDVAVEHRGIVEATLARDMPAVRRQMAAHFNRTSDILLASMSPEGVVAPAAPKPRRASGARGAGAKAARGDRVSA